LRASGAVLFRAAEDGAVGDVDVAEDSEAGIGTVSGITVAHGNKGLILTVR
jgi:hypothetical protein